MRDRADSLLPTPLSPCMQHADAEHLHQDAVHRGLGREDRGQHPQDPHRELRGGEVGLEDGTLRAFSAMCVKSSVGVSEWVNTQQGMV